MNLFQNLSESFSREAKKYTTLFLPKHRVDIEIDDTPISIGDAYCRIWLEDMNLSKDVDWFKQRYPVVHAAVRFHYDGELVTIPYLVAPGKLKEFGRFTRFQSSKTLALFDHATTIAASRCNNTSRIRSFRKTFSSKKLIINTIYLINTISLISQPLFIPTTHQFFSDRLDNIGRKCFHSSNSVNFI
jgi:hypothetical protein